MEYAGKDSVDSVAPWCITGAFVVPACTNVAERDRLQGVDRRKSLTILGGVLHDCYRRAA